jgi:hypothetical protein
MLMADLGADVIKIEVPGVGDSSRTNGEMRGGISSFFETNNRGVKSLTLNLKTDEGREILYKLVKEADIFGQNFRPGAAEKNVFGGQCRASYGLDVDHHHVSRPRPDYRCAHKRHPGAPRNRGELQRHRWQAIGVSAHAQGLEACYEGPKFSIDVRCQRVE